ncbi:hypothetical protein LSAT2_017173 [Lamellibrachia satsuma]|nr:hypothetical protein LSAT2_017173 [Lamellibrachia satsuma]
MLSVKSQLVVYIQEIDRTDRPSEDSQNGGHIASRQTTTQKCFRGPIGVSPCTIQENGNFGNKREASWFSSSLVLTDLRNISGTLRRGLNNSEVRLEQSRTRSG